MTSLITYEYVGSSLILFTLNFYYFIISFKKPVIYKTQNHIHQFNTQKSNLSSKKVPFTKTYNTLILFHSTLLYIITSYYFYWDILYTNTSWTIIYFYLTCSLLLIIFNSKLIQLKYILNLDWILSLSTLLLTVPYLLFCKNLIQLLFIL